MFASRLCSLSILLLALSASAAPKRPEVTPISATAAFDRLRTLVGNWVAPLPGGKQYRVSFRLVANDSALVETYTSSSGKDTLTIFTIDGDRLLATHYCAQGNQPRLALRGESDGALVFGFVDATNLRDPSKSHLDHLALALGRDELTETEVYRSAGKDDPDRFVFKRVP